MIVLDAWSCGGVIDHYPQLCTDGAYGYSVFNPDTYWGTYEMAASYGLWEYAFIEGESSSESIIFQHQSQVIYSQCLLDLLDSHYS